MKPSISKHPEQRALADSALQMPSLKSVPAEALHLIADLERLGAARSPRKPSNTDYAAALRLIREDNLARERCRDPSRASKTDPALIEASLIQLIKAGRFNALSTPLSQLPAVRPRQLCDGDTGRPERSSAAQAPAARESARVRFERLAGERDYYGHLAAQWTGHSLAAWQTKAPPSRLKGCWIWRQRPPPSESTSFSALGETLEARREWFQLIKPFSTTESSGLRQHSQVSGTGMTWRLQRWPRPKLGTRSSSASHGLTPSVLPKRPEPKGVPVTLAIAVARRESGFWTRCALARRRPRIDATHAPHGAKRCEIDRPRHPSELGSDPSIDTNIQLGTAYLGQLLQRFNDNRILALAAYNAGPSRAQKWHTHPQPIDAFIEGIPFAETRAYVKAVLLYAAIYAQLKRSTRAAPVPLRN